MKYVATGRVHPERADIHFGPIEWTFSNGARVVARCDSSQVTVALDGLVVDGWVSAYLQSEQFAQVVVGALGFALGTGYSVEVVQIIEEDGTPHVFGVRPTGTSGAETLSLGDHDSVFERAIKVSTDNVFFRLALRDYLRAIRDVVDCATYCYRAIEAIKSSFAFATGTEGWQEMHNALGTDRHTIDATVKVYADPVRHGNWAAAKSTDSRIRWEMLRLTRDVLVKYLDHVSPPGATGGASHDSAITSLDR